MTDVAKIPVHIGYILDGNRRWAKKHGVPTYEGHLAGYNALEDVIRATSAAGVKYISFYTFSTENWNRAEDEVTGLMRLIRQLFRRDLKRLTQEGYRLVIMGGKEQLPADIVTMIEEAEHTAHDGAKATLVICFNYGGQQEIIRAVQRLVASGASTDGLTPDAFSQFLDHPEVPPCDLVVRTSGEQRLSNFMLWRSAYSELLFVDKYWPEMTTDDVTAILEEYARRTRRFGG